MLRCGIVHDRLSVRHVVALRLALTILAHDASQWHFGSGGVKR
jgi:hypothetical protein